LFMTWNSSFTFCYILGQRIHIFFDSPICSLVLSITISFISNSSLIFLLRGRTSTYDDIPVEVSDGCPEALSEFSEEIIGPQLYRNLLLSKFTRPTPVQKYSIPIGLAGGDMMACAQTGSGKTGGFLFPVITMMTRSGARQPPDDRRGRGTFVSALILAPTRELASQIFDEANKFCYCTGVRPVVVYGGANIQQQQKELEKGADLLVATPGRLVDLIQRGRVKLDCVQFLVLDEADRMLDMGFEPQIRNIVEESGMPRDRQTFMFSATFPIEIQRLATDFMKNYIFVAVGRVGAASKDVTQTIMWKEQEEKYQFVVEFLSALPPGGLVLIFVETKRGADYLEETLYRQGFQSSSIHGDKSQREREDALKSFKSGRSPFLVATDVAARGLDIPNVTQVINFDMPTNIDDYVHRIGRTGRVGNVGNALSLFNDKNRNIGKELAELMIENDQICPEWLERYLGGQTGYRGGGGRGRGRGGNKFGARDYRKDSNTGVGHGSHSGGGGRGGGRHNSQSGGPPASTGATNWAGPPAANYGPPAAIYSRPPAGNGSGDNSANLDLSRRNFIIPKHAAAVAVAVNSAATAC
ncbi:unnamed protein product, partial [Sphagnum jensenii]